MSAPIRTSVSADNDEDFWLIRALGCFLFVVLEGLLYVSTGYVVVFSPLFCFVCLPLLCRQRQRPAHPARRGGDDSSYQSREDYTQVNQSTGTEALLDFEEKINEIKAKILDDVCGNDMEEQASVASMSQNSAPISGVYTVHSSCRGLAVEKYTIDLEFESSSNSKLAKIRGKGQSLCGGKKLVFNIQEGILAITTGEAYWVAKTIRRGSRILSYGRFNFLLSQSNAFQGQFLSNYGPEFICSDGQFLPSNGPKGRYILFQLVTPLASKARRPETPRVSAEEGPSMIAEARLISLPQERDEIDIEILPIAFALPILSRAADGKPPITQNLKRGEDPLPESTRQKFRAAVVAVGCKTTAVDVRAKKIVINPTDDDTTFLDGTYDLHYQWNGGRSGRKGTMELTFKRGFSGWFIKGFRDDPEDGIFSIADGFLAHSGKIYWEDRTEGSTADPATCMLWYGQLSGNSNEAGLFFGIEDTGTWLSSEGMQIGKIIKFCRRRDDDDDKRNELVSSKMPEIV